MIGGALKNRRQMRGYLDDGRRLEEQAADEEIFDRSKM